LNGVFELFFCFSQKKASSESPTRQLAGNAKRIFLTRLFLKFHQKIAIKMIHLPLLKTNR